MDVVFLLIVLAAVVGYSGSDTYRKRLAAIDAEDAQRGDL